MADLARPLHHLDMDTDGLAHLLRWVQDGVVSRAQLLELGARPHDVRRMLRRRDLTVVHPGVYVTHTGPLTWEQRAWAAVLAHDPAALARESALPGRREDGPIHVAVDVRRTVAPLAGVVVHRTGGFRARVVVGSAPPRIGLEHAAIDVASAATDTAARFRVLADVVQTRRTSAAAIRTALQARRGVAHGVELSDLLADLESGACSVLERAYLLLERRHGLSGPDVRRQEPGVVRGGRVYRDVDHPGLGVVVELDGRAFHDTAAARDRDARRDLASAVDDDRVTVRLTYAMVVRDGCATMADVAALLTRRGWTGQLLRCPDCP